MAEIKERTLRSWQLSSVSGIDWDKEIDASAGGGQSMGVPVELDLTEKVLSACSGSIITSLLGTEVSRYI